MRWRTCTRVIAMLCLGASLFGCGEGDVGEECDESGSTQECVADAVCTGEGGGEARCRLICATQDDCPEGFNCNGIDGRSSSELKSCQP